MGYLYRSVVGPLTVSTGVYTVDCGSSRTGLTRALQRASGYQASTSPSRSSPVRKLHQHTACLSAKTALID